MNATDMITVAHSRLDGARAAAKLIVEGRLTPDVIDEPRALGLSWGEEDFSLGDAAQSAFLASGCEEFSRHHQWCKQLGIEWGDDHCVAFCQGFRTVATECLWAGGING